MAEENNNDTEAKLAEIPNIFDEVNIFVRQIDSLRTTLPDLMLSVRLSRGLAEKEFTTFADKFAEKIDKKDEFTDYAFKPPHDRGAMRLNEKINRTKIAYELAPRFFVLALVSQFDAFVGRLIRALFMLKPQLISSSDRTLSFAELMELGTIENATEYVLDKEIESVLRKSHSEQFKWMENKFAIPLNVNLESWPTFIELTERRNLFAHNDGIVSDQYLTMCKNNGVELEDGCDKGSRLTVSPEYFDKAYSCIFEIGFKLSQVLWRKLVPKEIDKADQSLVDVPFDLIVNGRLELAIKLLDFGCCVLKKHSSEEYRLIITLNRAQAYKWSSNSEKCKDILSQEDWSACSARFQLPVAVLQDDFEKAVILMKKIGQEDSMKTGYHEWPIFQEFRNSREFSETYEEVFGEPFVHIEKAFREGEKKALKSSVDDLIKNLEKELSTED